jgi:uncharacterized tellurite resistance protein B-like protein
MVLARLKALFAKPRDAHDPSSLRVAAAALLVEAAVLDGHFSEPERQAIAAILRRRFDLDEGEAAELLADATAHQAQATDLYALTRTLNRVYDEAERIKLIEMVCEVAYADGALHDHEASLLRRVGELIYVSDRDRAAARQRVLSRLAR